MGEWQKVKTAKDVDKLLEFYGGFHDSCIKEIRYISGAGVNDDKAMFFGESKDRQVTIVFQRQREPILVELRFDGMRHLNVIGWQRNYFCDIFDCYLAIRNDLVTGLDDILIVWADSKNFDPKVSIESSILSEPRTTFVIAESLLWREVTANS